SFVFFFICLDYHRSFHSFPTRRSSDLFMLAWYFITHYAALQLPARKRLTSPVFSWYGIVGCLGLTLAMPSGAVFAAAGTLAVLTSSRWLLRRAISRQ